MERLLFTALSGLYIIICKTEGVMEWQYIASNIQKGYRATVDTERYETFYIERLILKRKQNNVKKKNT